MQGSMRYTEDKNLVHITGTIQKLPESIRYIPRPILKFEIDSYRRQKEQRELETDTLQMVLFDDENFLNEFKNGDRIEIKGELQSRNYTTTNYEIDDIFNEGVKNYISLFNEFPTSEEPTNKRRIPILWSKLLLTGLIPEVPDDSLYDWDGSKVSGDEKYVYRVDHQGIVYKEKQHVAYEVVITEYKKLKGELNPKHGDINKVTMIGKLVSNIHSRNLGEYKIPFTNFQIKTKSSFYTDDTVSFHNIISWGDIATFVDKEVKTNDFLHVVGRLQSRTYTKEVIKRWRNPNGVRKKKTIILELNTHEISASSIKKLRNG